jgi:hypothetical protein
MALEQGVVIPSRSGFLKTLSQSQRNALCILLQSNNKQLLIRFFRPTTEEARASQASSPRPEYAVVRALQS